MSDLLDDTTKICAGAGLWTLANGIWPLHHPVFIGLTLLFVAGAICLIRYVR